MMDAVHRYEGTVNQVLGDGIMALFGAPIAHEDHALRACYAALALQSAIRPYAEEVRRTHGIAAATASGAQLRRGGGAGHWQRSAYGLLGGGADTRTWRRAWSSWPRPAVFCCTAATLRLVEGLVQVNALGPIPVKGLTEPVEVFELVGASALRRRLQAAAVRGLTRFVGRETEMAALGRR